MDFDQVVSSSIDVKKSTEESSESEVFIKEESEPIAAETDNINNGMEYSMEVEYRYLDTSKEEHDWDKSIITCDMQEQRWKKYFPFCQPEFGG